MQSTIKQEDSKLKEKKPHLNTFDLKSKQDQDTKQIDDYQELNQNFPPQLLVRRQKYIFDKIPSNLDWSINTNTINALKANYSELNNLQCFISIEDKDECINNIYRFMQNINSQKDDVAIFPTIILSSIANSLHVEQFLLIKYQNKNYIVDLSNTHFFQEDQQFLENIPNTTYRADNKILNPFLDTTPISNDTYKTYTNTKQQKQNLKDLQNTIIFKPEGKFITKNGYEIDPISQTDGVSCASLSVALLISAMKEKEFFYNIVKETALKQQNTNIFSIQMPEKVIKNYQNIAFIGLITICNNNQKKNAPPEECHNAGLKFLIDKNKSQYISKYHERELNSRSFINGNKFAKMIKYYNDNQEPMPKEMKHNIKLEWQNIIRSNNNIFNKRKAEFQLEKNCDKKVKYLM